MFDFDKKNTKFNAHRNILKKNKKHKKKKLFGFNLFLFLKNKKKTQKYILNLKNKEEFPKKHFLGVFSIFKNCYLKQF